MTTNIIATLKMTKCVITTWSIATVQLQQSQLQQMKLQHIYELQPWLWGQLGALLVATMSCNWVTMCCNCVAIGPVATTCIYLQLWGIQLQQNLHDCNIGNCNTIDRQLQHNWDNCNTTRNLGEKSKNKSIYSYAMYMGMDFPMVAQAGAGWWTCPWLETSAGSR